MIPVFKVPLEVDVDVGVLQYPPEDVLTEEGGLVCNHDYMDMRHRSWESFFLSHRAESYLVTEAGRRAKTEEEFDSLLNQFLEDNRRGFCNYDGVELGVSSVTLALSAFECVPAESCRGHFEGLDNTLPPHVVLWAEKEKAKDLISLARKSKVGLGNCNMEGYEALLLYAQNIPNLMAFGKGLYNLYGKRGLDRETIKNHPGRILW